MAEPALLDDGRSFLDTYRGYLEGVLQWDQLDSLWRQVRKHPTAWFVYAVGEAVPTNQATPEQLDHFIQSVDTLLRKEHDADYCGIVYTDNPLEPTLIKIYDPNNLGVVCGFSDNPPLPGWLVSRIQPVDLEQALTPPATRRRWWNRIFG